MALSALSLNPLQFAQSFLLQYLAHGRCTNSMSKTIFYTTILPKPFICTNLRALWITPALTLFAGYESLYMGSIKPHGLGTTSLPHTSHLMVLKVLPHILLYLFIRKGKTQHTYFYMSMILYLRHLLIIFYARSPTLFLANFS